MYAVFWHEVHKQTRKKKEKNTGGYQNIIFFTNWINGELYKTEFMNTYDIDLNNCIALK